MIFHFFDNRCVLGSETNTVHLYQREISRPLLSYKFDDQNNGTTKTTNTVTVRSYIDKVKNEPILKKNINFN